MLLLREDTNTLPNLFISLLRTPNKATSPPHQIAASASPQITAGPGVSTGSRGRSSRIQGSARKPRCGPYSYMRAIKRMSTVATWARVAPAPGLSSPVVP